MDSTSSARPRSAVSKTLLIGNATDWTLLTGHGHVLVEITRNPEARIRDIAAGAGLTERAVQHIVADLEAAGYLTRTRTGRRTTYKVDPEKLFRHSPRKDTGSDRSSTCSPRLATFATPRNRSRIMTRQARPTTEMNRLSTVLKLSCAGLGCYGEAGGRWKVSCPGSHFRQPGCRGQ